MNRKFKQLPFTVVTYHLPFNCQFSFVAWNERITQINNFFYSVFLHIRSIMQLCGQNQRRPFLYFLTKILNIITLEAFLFFFKVLNTSKFELNVFRSFKDKRRKFSKKLFKKFSHFRFHKFFTSLFSERIFQKLPIVF